MPFFVTHAELFPALCPTGRKHLLAIGGGHACAESMLVAAFPFAGLKSPFHCVALFHLKIGGQK